MDFSSSDKHSNKDEKRFQLPAKLPEGLNADEYLKLALKYHLLGDFSRSIKAGRKALDREEEDLIGSSLAYMQEKDFIRAKKFFEKVDDSLTFTTRAFGLSKSIFSLFLDQIRHSNEKTDEFISEKELLRVFKYAVEKLFQEATSKMGMFTLKVAHAAVLATHPSREVPEGLKKEEYMRLGKRYLSLYWPDQAKDSFRFVIDLDGKGKLAEAARVYISTRLPKDPTPYLAVKRFIEARRLSNLGEAEAAIAEYESLINDYPNFEWPLEQASIHHINKFNVDYAVELLLKILDYNPKYVGAYQQLARAYALQGAILESQIALDKAISLGLNSHEVANLRQVVSMLSKLE